MESREGRISSALEGTDEHSVVHMLSVGEKGTFMTALGIELLNGHPQSDSLLAAIWWGREGLTDEYCTSPLLLLFTD